MTDGPLAAYRALCQRGEIRADPAQEAAVARLDILHHALRDCRPPATPNGLLARLGLGGRAPGPAPRGLYLWGPVGRGKSMVMDRFFAAAPVEAKRRVHFHAFMLEVHRRLEQQRRRHRKPDPVQRLARELADQARLLCLDEFHVRDVADAMILGRLFEALLVCGVVVVATSNLPPARLYEGGLNRDRVLPFIELLSTRLDVVALDGPTDYRLERLRDVPVYLHPLGTATDAKLGEIFTTLTDGEAGEAEAIAIGSRRLVVPRAAKGVAWFDFAELCEQPLGAADYLALTERYHTVVLAGLPRLTPDRRNEARRLITLIDALYDRRVNLVIGAALPPESLYPEGEGAFEFRRTVSRLAEMQSREYLESTPLARDAARGFSTFALTTDVI